MRARTPIRFVAVALLLWGWGHWSPDAQAQQARAVTFDQLLEYVELGVPAAKLEQLVADSPTRFVLGEKQLDRLRAAGASEGLLQALANPAPVVGSGDDASDFVLILDCSGSMNDRLPDGGTKWQAAQRAALDMVSRIPPGRRLSLIVYGTDLARKCHAVDVVRELAPLETADQRELAEFIGRLKAVGHTPIARSLELAGAQLETAQGLSSIILITDGMESCHGDPAAVAAQLVENLPHLRGGINVIGFGLGGEESRQVANIATAGRGAFYDAQTADQLLASVRKIEVKSPPAIVLEEVHLEGLSPLERLLVAQLGDPDIDARAEAAAALGKRQVQPAVAALGNMLLEAPYGTGLDGDADRDAAARAITAIAPERLGTTLARVFASPSRPVRIWAAEAVREYQAAGATEAVVARLQALDDGDLPTSAINGSDEADALFAALATVAPDRAETVLAQLMRGRSAHVKSWAATMASKLP